MAATKQVIVVRRDLNMSQGKTAAQASHASLGVFTKHWDSSGDTVSPPPITDPDIVAWLRSSFTKICVAVDSEAELHALAQSAESQGLPFCLIRDNGLTEFKGVPTYTVLAIGPASSERIDPLTRKLPLLK